ncbi:putative ferric-chelate reductase 1 homolog [Centruroides sculpturatus]|uniref:putative ferric-chelate reductase 1 homolog n=1 Tax=Centruroides sculpturatus TaxID=218467 RepID=UPI000C6ED912|nr:putative ferric-chelate reductase 1 homolog [Centruroides sculpturatus]
MAIRRLDPQASFKGFMVQALDKETGKYIGKFIEAPGLAVMKECSAVSHSNPKPKIAVHLAWVAPNDHSGQVVFRATIVETKKVFYEGLQSQLDRN